MTGREKRTSQWQIFDVHNGLMSAFDRDIGGRRVTLCALAWPRGFCCHSWWQWLSPCRLNWCLQICPGCTFFPPLGSTSWWWVADETNRPRHWCLRFHHTERAVAYQASCTAAQRFQALKNGTVLPASYVCKKMWALLLPLPSLWRSLLGVGRWNAAEKIKHQQSGCW